MIEVVRPNVQDSMCASGDDRGADFAENAIESGTMRPKWEINAREVGGTT